MKLGHFRDIIAHCDLALIKPDDLTFFIRGNTYPLLNGFAKEGLIDADLLMGQLVDRLEKLAIDHTADLKARVAKRLEYHARIFKMLSPQELTRAAERPHPPLHDDQWEEPVDCPACGKKGYARLERDYDLIDGEPHVSGAYVDIFGCPYCELMVADYEELDELGITLEKIYIE